MTSNSAESEQAKLTIDSRKTISCQGKWTLSYLNSAFAKISLIADSVDDKVAIQGDHISQMDSAGAWVLIQLQRLLIQKHKTVSFLDFSSEHASLLDLVQQDMDEISQPIPLPRRPLWLEQIGQSTMTHYRQGIEFTAFIGQIVLTLWATLFHPRRIQWKALLNVIDETGFQALGIVGLLSSLIGVVMAYQTAAQLKLYGANTYIIPILGVSILQEFAPLITAIIVAGRTSSAFTAQIGSMQINAEIDALRTMGFSPINLLVLPKMFGLFVSFPLLIVWADIFGLLGGIIVSSVMLKIGFYGFLLSFPQEIQLQTLINGLIKAPVFAILIASVGCFHGFKVSSTADSIGRETTKSVVQAIFLIIIADSIFSIILPWQSV